MSDKRKVTAAAAAVLWAGSVWVLVLGPVENADRLGAAASAGELRAVRGLDDGTLLNEDAPTTDCSEYVDTGGGYLPDFGCPGNAGEGCVSCGDQYYNNMVPFGNGSPLYQSGTHDCSLFQYKYGTCTSGGVCNTNNQPVQGNCSGTIDNWLFEP
jgi:hypothetical protein